MGKTAYQLIFILVLAFFLRLVNLNQSFWLDEGTQMVMSSQSLTFQWVGRSADFHPPLFYFLMHLWLKLGTSEWFLRLLPVLFGVATVFAIYLLGKNLANEKVGLWSSFLLAISPYHVFYSQEMRMYSLLALLGALSMYFLLKRNWLLYGLSVLLLLYTHYASVFLLVAQVIWILFYEKDSIKSFLVSLFFGFLFYLPWLPQFLHQLASGGNLVEILPGWKQVASLPALKAIPLTLMKFSLGRVTFDNNFFYLAVALAIFLVLGLLFYNFCRKLNKEKIFLINGFLAPLILAVFLSFFLPLYQPFRLLYTIVPFLLILAVVLSLLRKRWLVIFAGLIFLINFSGLWLSWTNPRFQRENWRGAVQFIEAQNPQDSVALFEFSEPFASYQWYSQQKVKAIGVLPGLIASEDLISQTLPVAIKTRERVFLFEYLQPLTDPQRLVENHLLRNGFVNTETKDFSGVGFIFVYNRVR